MSKLTVLGLFALALSASVGLAQEPGQEPEQEKEASKPWSLELSLDWVTAYWFRGYNVEDSGYILQPAATFSYTVYDAHDLTITPKVTAWESIHEKKSPNDPKHWFESDLYGIIEFGWKGWTLSTIYNRYMYPGNAAGTTEELGLSLSYDDSEWAKKAGLPFSFQPHVTWLDEISDENGEQDQYWEVGIAPGFDIGNTKFSVSIPLVVGLSTDSYYTDSSGSNDFFGYASAGVEVSHPLPVPEKFGTWTITAGGYYVYLNATSARDTNNGDPDGWWGKLGIKAEF